MKAITIFLIIVLTAYLNKEELVQLSWENECKPCTRTQSMSSYGKGALLATRFKDLDAFKRAVKVEYVSDYDKSDPKAQGRSAVRLFHCSEGKQMKSELQSGIDQDEIIKAHHGTNYDKFKILTKSPETIFHRVNISKVRNLGRKRPQLFGENDVAFYDLAVASFKKIHRDERAFRSSSDSSEKGYINTFNHITAQAIMTLCFSEQFADYIADVHERKNMASLTTGLFTKEELSDPNDNPVENYVDMINNEWGQELGKTIQQKLELKKEMVWSEHLFCMVMNEIQQYYAWAFDLKMEPFYPDEILIKKFTHKLNIILQSGIIN